MGWKLRIDVWDEGELERVLVGQWWLSITIILIAVDTMVGILKDLPIIWG